MLSVAVRQKSYQLSLKRIWNVCFGETSVLIRAVSENSPSWVGHDRGTNLKRQVMMLKKLKLSSLSLSP
jgi:hypothetical protein